MNKERKKRKQGGLLKFLSLRHSKKGMVKIIRGLHVGL